MWGIVKSRLLIVINGLWQEIFENLNIDIESRGDERISPLANRLTLTLSSSR
jgi:hypothetical protein